MNRFYLPVELWFCIGDFLEYFDIINMNYVLNLRIPVRNLGDAINKFSNDGNIQLMLYKIVTIERKIDYNIINIIKDIYHITTHRDICWKKCNIKYTFVLHLGDALNCKGSKTLDCEGSLFEYTFDIYFTNIKLLRYYLVTYLHFKITSEFILNFTIKCNIKRN